MPRTVIIVIGPMCSGKSTFCQAAAKAGYLIANDDAIVTAVHGGTYGLYSKSLKPLYKGIELEIIRTGLAVGRDVIVDRATNMNLHCRRKYIGLATSLGRPGARHLDAQPRPGGARPSPLLQEQPGSELRALAPGGAAALTGVRQADLCRGVHRDHHAGGSLPAVHSRS